MTETPEQLLGFVRGFLTDVDDDEWAVASVTRRDRRGRITGFAHLSKGDLVALCDLAERAVTHVEAGAA